MHRFEGKNIHARCKLGLQIPGCKQDGGALKHCDGTVAESRKCHNPSQRKEKKSPFKLAVTVCALILRTDPPEILTS